LTSHLERTVVSEKMFKDDLSQVEESVTKSTYKLGVGFERCEDKLGVLSPPFQRMLLFTCFVAMLVTWMSFTSIAKELRRDILIMLESHITMSSLIFRLVLILVRCLASFMDLTIAHMILVHERTTLGLDALVTIHAVIVVIISRVGMVFLLEGLTLALSPDTCTVHVFPIVVHVLLVQKARCKRL
jgi:hypothetical protein